MVQMSARSLAGVLTALWSMALWVFYGVAQWVAQQIGAQRAGAPVRLTDWSARHAPLQLAPGLPSGNLSAGAALLALFTSRLAGAAGAGSRDYRLADTTARAGMWFGQARAGARNHCHASHRAHWPSKPSAAMPSSTPPLESIR